ncbi:MAG: hypothetical protein P1U85_03970 [Verrucomicrobiales bacterium]|nr:hypothetical protein [Verrucomicrobiales bacterium]
MKRIYHVTKPSRWIWITWAINLVFQILILWNQIREYSRGADFPYTHLCFVAAFVLLGIPICLRDIRRREKVVAENGTLWIFHGKGKNEKGEEVVTVTEDQLAYFLYGKKHETTVAKSKVSDELAEILTARVEE